MKRLIDTFLKMIYPALISLAVYAFTDAFVSTSSEHSVIIIFISLSVFFFSILLFLIGFFMNIAYCIKHKSE